MSTFSRFPPRLQEAIVHRLGWTALRREQELAGAAILDGKNVVVLAPTAGGKTEAAVFPALAELIERPPEAVGALYVAPLKALLNNQEPRLGLYAEMVGLRHFVWHGDTEDGAKRAFSKEPAELLLTTPESLEVMLVSSRVPVARLFSDLRVAIIDEVHSFAGTDRGAHLASVLERLGRLTKNDVQRVGLSATVGNPEAVLAWLKGTSRREGVVVNPERPKTRRDLLVLEREDVRTLADEAGRRAAGKKSLFFCPSRALTEVVAEKMRGRGTEVFVHHSSVSLEERRAAEERFQHGKNACIVCTSTLELGIDVGDLELVLQAEAPSTVSSFLQRLGRTGRRPDTVANTTFFCTSAETALQAAALIELAREGWVEPVAVPARCWPVLVHQLLALTLQLGAVSAEKCWEQLAHVPDVSGITRAEFEALVAHMKTREYLFESGGLLSMGSEAEQVFGRKNFLELYAIFSSPALYRVVGPAGRELGSLEQGFVDRLVEEMSSFLLAGRAWAVEHIDHGERRIKVREAPRGLKPTWGGGVPQLLGFELCQRMKQVLLDESRAPYLDPAAADAIDGLRRDLGPLLRADGWREVEGVWQWWTFAGGRINHTLRYGFEVAAGWKVRVDNLHLELKAMETTVGAIESALAALRNEGFWDDPKIWSAILARLPAYRLSKFQRALPDGPSRELVAGYLLDVPGTKAFLARRPPAPAPLPGPSLAAPPDPLSQ